MAIDPEAHDNKRQHIVALITKLWGHYWLPEMPRALADELMIDWIYDLENFDIAAIEEGCNVWRRSPQAFFPKPGQLLKIVVDEQRTINRRREDRANEENKRRVALMVKIAPASEPLLEDAEFFARPYPHAWWFFPKNLWRPNWSEERIPEEWRETARIKRGEQP